MYSRSLVSNTRGLLRAFGGGLGFDDPRVLHLSDGGGGGPRTQVPCPLRLYAPLRRVAHAQFQRQCGWLGGFSHLSTAIAGDFLEPFRAFATQKEGDLATRSLVTQGPTCRPFGPPRALGCQGLLGFPRCETSDFLSKNKASGATVVARWLTPT